MNQRVRVMMAMWVGAWSLGCQAGASRDGDQPDGLEGELEGREFLSTSIAGHDLVEGTQIRLRFRDGELSAHAGCNHIAGSFVLEGGVLLITGLGSTAIGCGAELHAQDEWLSELLTGSPTIALDDAEVTLETDDAKLTLLDRELASPDRPLVGTHWIGNGTGDQNAISFGPGSELVSVDFAQDGTLEAFTACQNGVGTFTASEATIELEEMGYDDVVCGNAGFESLAAQVRFVLASDATLAFEIEEANLTLERDGKLLMFRADE